MSIFTERRNYKPFEYVGAIDLMEKINHTYWLHSELTFNADKSDFSNLPYHEKEAVRRSLCAISTIEVKVKNFWTQLGDHFPKPEFAMLGVTAGESECFSDDTEILTPVGFKLFKDLLDEDKIAQYSLMSKEITFVKPLNYIEKDFIGIMHNYKGKDSNMLITPKHEIITIHPTSKKIKKCKSEDGVWSRNYRYPVSGYLNTDKKVLTPLERMLISLQADGSVFGCTPSGRKAGRRDVAWNIKKERKIKRLVEILDATGLKYNKRTQIRESGEYCVISLQLPDEIDNDSIKNFGWLDLNSLNSDYVNDFLEELSHWDAHVKENTIAYYNSNEEAVNKLQAFAILGGFHSYKSINRTAEQSMLCERPQSGFPKSTKTTYRLSFKKMEDRVYPHRYEVDYSGKVYCVTVPEGNIVTRRKGCISIQGNCRHSESYSRLLTVLDLEDDFLDSLEVNALQGRFDYLEKYLKLSPHNSDKRKYIVKLILFSVLVENVSLFSQFATVMYFYRHKGIMKDIRNIIKWTAIDEQLHFNIGVYIVGILREEHPELFDEELNDIVKKACIKSVKYEQNILDWIFENGELEKLTKTDLLHYMESRVNDSMSAMGFSKVFEGNKDLKSTDFFFEEVFADSMDDFFANRPVDYTLGDKSITSEDLFD